MHSSDWVSLGSTQKYAKVPIYYDMAWEVPIRDFDNLLVHPCPFAGPICVLGFESSLGDQPSLTLRFHRQTGELLTTLVPEVFKTAKLVKGGAGWASSSHHQVFVLVSQCGKFCSIEPYTWRVQVSDSFKDVDRKGKELIYANIVDDHAVALASDGGVVIARNIGLVFANPSGVERQVIIEKTMTSTLRTNLFTLHLGSAVIPPRFECLVAMGSTVVDETLVILTSHGNGQLIVTYIQGTLARSVPVIDDDCRGTFVSTHSSLSGHCFALANVRGDLYILRIESRSHDRSKFNVDELCEPRLLPQRLLNEEPHMRPAQVRFADDPSRSLVLACYYPQQRSVLLFNSKDDWIKFEYGEECGVALVQEIDGVRVVTSTFQELLLPVPSSLLRALEFGSVAPAAVLIDAVETEGLLSGETLAGLSEEGILLFAVEDCIYAALASFEQEEQQRLLRAASQGKLYLNDIKERARATKAFLRAAEALHILNVVRTHRVAVPLTSVQYARSGEAPGLAIRLALSGFHFLALKVLHHGAASLRGRNLSNAICCIKVIWGRAVLKSGFTTNATLMLEKLRTVLHDSASKSRSRVYCGAEYLLAKNALTITQQGNPWAFEVAMGLINEERDYRKRALRLCELMAYEEALRVCVERLDGEFASYVRIHQKDMGSNEIELTNGTSEYLHSTRTAETLLHEELLRLGLEPMTLADACCTLLSQRRKTEADKLRKTFSLSERIFWICRVRAAITLCDWSELERIVAEKPRQCGVAVTWCMRAGENDNALRLFRKYALKCSEEERVDWYLQLRQYADAIRTALLIRSQSQRERAILSCRVSIHADPTLTESELSLLAQLIG